MTSQEKALASSSTAAEQEKARAMKLRAMSCRTIDVIFVLAMLATYGSLVGGLLGFLTARLVSLITLAGVTVGASAALGLVAFSLRNQHRLR
ncbi:MAG TPA: hypothetical protein VII40_07990 [Xanthobacteraceae bacterium]|jgi:hypothetical protein